MVTQLQAVLDRHALCIELQGTNTACQYRAAGQVRGDTQMLLAKEPPSLHTVKFCGFGPLSAAHSEGLGFWGRRF